MLFWTKQEPLNSLSHYGVLVAPYKAKSRLLTNTRSLRFIKHQRPISLQVNLQSMRRINTGILTLLSVCRLTHALPPFFVGLVIVRCLHVQADYFTINDCEIDISFVHIRLINVPSVCHDTAKVEYFRTLSDHCL